jgi:hypothetical protein
MTMLAMRLGGVALPLHIRRAVEVLGVRFDHEVRGIAARRVRDGAGMASFQSFRDRTPIEHQGYQVGQLPASGAAPQADQSVARWQTVAKPWPALIGVGSLDLRPESLLKRSDDKFGAKVRQWITVTLPAPVVHRAPTTLFGGLHAV